MKKVQRVCKMNLNYLNNNQKRLLGILLNKAKNVYNEGLYMTNMYYENTGENLKYSDINDNRNKINNWKYLISENNQQILRNLEKNFKSFFVLNKKYPDKGYRPPKYKKYHSQIHITYCQGFGTLYKTGYFQAKTTIDFRERYGSPDIKIKIPKFIIEKRYPVNEIRIAPKGYKKFEAQIIYTISELYDEDYFKEIELDENKFLGIDLGLNNLATCISNANMPFIINGKPIKSENQWYNKKVAKLKSKLPKYKTRNGEIKQVSWSKRLQSLTEKRNNRVEDYMHKASKMIVDYCVSNKISKIIIGKNKDWKKQINIGKINNQNFVSIPFNSLVSKIQYKAERYGIKVIIREESYTSKASFIDDDKIPDKYHKNEKFIFIGKRNGRNYRTQKGHIINADLNGAANIVRKEVKLNKDDEKLLKSILIENKIPKFLAS